MSPRIWKIKNPLTLPMKFTFGEDGWIVAEFPSLPGCMSQGKTLDEAVLNLADAIQAVLKIRMQEGVSIEPIYS